jgi:hypothetical protein
MWVVITQMQAAQKNKGASTGAAATTSSSSGSGGGGSGAAAVEEEPQGGSGVSSKAAAADGTGALTTARRLYRDQGFAGFYQGLRPSLIMVLNPTIQVRGRGLVEPSLLGDAACCFWSGWLPDSKLHQSIPPAHHAIHPSTRPSIHPPTQQTVRLV